MSAARMCLSLLICLTGLACAQTPDPPGAESNGVAQADTTSLEEQIQELQTRLVSLRMRYTDQHPTVLSTLRQLEELQARLAAQTAAPAESG